MFESSENAESRLVNTARIIGKTRKTNAGSLWDYGRDTVKGSEEDFDKDAFQYGLVCGFLRTGRSHSRRVSWLLYPTVDGHAAFHGGSERKMVSTLHSMCEKCDSCSALESGLQEPCVRNGF